MVSWSKRKTTGTIALVILKTCYRRTNRYADSCTKDENGASGKKGLHIHKFCNPGNGKNEFRIWKKIDLDKGLSKQEEKIRKRKLK